MTEAGVSQSAPTSSDVAERVRSFQRDGYVVQRRMFSPDEMNDFIVECHSFEGRTDRPNSNDAGEMRFYSELFRKSQRVQQFITQQALLDFIVPIAGPDLWVRWDQAVAKGPRSGVFPWHTDNGYDLLPQPHFEIWIALSQSTKDNGGLCVVPGSHKQRHRHRRVGNHMLAVASHRYDAPDSGKVFIDANVGDVIVRPRRSPPVLASLSVRQRQSWPRPSVSAPSICSACCWAASQACGMSSAARALGQPAARRSKRSVK